MKHVIYIIRHAKASRNLKYQDYERPLSKRGQKDSAKLGEWMRLAGCRPDAVIASNAVRGRHTADIVASALGARSERIRYEQTLYGATVTRWMLQLRNLDEGTVHGVLLVGHNPEMSQLAAKLTGIRGLAMPPGGLVAVQSKVAWKNTGMAARTPSSGLLWSHYPKRYSALRPEIADITIKAAKEASKLLPAEFRSSESQHLLSEGIQVAVSKILNREVEAKKTPGGKGKAKRKQ